MSEEKIERWKIADRVAHALLMLGVLLAILTGLILFDSDLFQFLGLLFVGSTRSLIHRVAAIILGASAIIHLSSRALNRKTEVLPTRKDIRDFFTIGLHWFGLTKEYPEIGFHHPGEKFLYWGAAFTGLLLTGISGILLWFPTIAPDLYGLALCVHDIGFGVICIAIAGHLMLSINPMNRPVLKAMFTNGLVSKTWAAKHHPAWWKELSHQKTGDVVDIHVKSSITKNPD
ncbi:MAG: hypothetical protein GTN80_06260 [Nitrososphaeria archaeon]|nr:hypothetical protein [Nitrososphaeria archaeon]NIQ33229.1 hypothetical protein [Nitrososphaeria archaeon]